MTGDKKVTSLSQASFSVSKGRALGQLPSGPASLSPSALALGSTGISEAPGGKDE